MSKPSDKNHPQNKPSVAPNDNLKAIAKYSGIAFQMGAITFLGAWGGTRLDAYFGFEKNILTAILTILAVVLAVYLSIKDFLKMK
jgi:hypothetical protein